MRDETERLQELLRYFFDKFAGRPTLYITDDCSATKELTKKKDMLSQLAFSGWHAEQSVWVISQRYISVLKDLLEQAKYRGLTGGFLLLQNFSVAISVSPHVCFILVLILISVFLR